MLEDNMIVRIKAFANFRDILGKDLNIEVKEGSTIKELLDDLISSRQRLKSALFDESGQIREYVILMKNRKNINSMGGLDTPLAEGDEVAILPPVAGG
jgi:molybdopterin synthase sulfur carrier subunit